MADIIPFALIGTLISVLLSVTTYAVIEYYKRLNKAQKEYEKAKDFVEDIVLSFNRELKREAERIRSVASKVDINASNANFGLRKVENIEERLSPFEKKITEIGMQVDCMNVTIESICEANVKAIEKMEKVDTTIIDSKLNEIEVSQISLKTKLNELEEQMQNILKLSQNKIEGALSVVPVMPIKRDKAMAALTETEVDVLEFLSLEGPKTAPEIKEKVRLSREHTARLMKKLYEEGYLERETIKLPFKYSVKKEMEKLLKKTETPV